MAGQEGDIARAADETLVAGAQAGDQGHLDELLRRYRALVKSKARMPAPPGLEHDDLVQEGMIGLFKAVRDYSPVSGAPFGAFADLCVERQIVSAMRAATRKKHTPLNMSVPFDYSGEGDEDAALRDRTAVNPLTAVIAKEEIKRVRGSLTAREAAVLRQRATGASYQDIAARLGISPKAVDNALQRAKGKLL
jgi:RNA polymerase sporulation-specific sigma factor